MNVTSNNYSIELTTDKNEPGTTVTAPAKLPRPNLTDTRLKTLTQLYAKDSVTCGSKAANLGEIVNNLTEISVPDGFCIPFAQYHQFMQHNGLEAYLTELEAQPDFQNSSSVRKKELEKLRQMIVSWQLDPKLVQGWVAQWEKQLKRQGVFVRSSSNSEDLPNFSGAGLYTTIPNVKTAQDLEMAVKQSWASVFNYEAYEARRVAKIPQNSVMMSTFVQTAINADASGVMITADPFDSTHYHTTYIVAKRGIGIRVVEGKRLAEQIMYNHFSHAIQVISRSDEQTALALDDNGGVREIPLNGDRVVLTDKLIVQLADAGLLIKMLFANQEQDIEWAIKDGKVIILQARPYIQK